MKLSILVFLIFQFHRSLAINSMYHVGFGFTEEKKESQTECFTFSVELDEDYQEAFSSRILAFASRIHSKFSKDSRPAKDFFEFINPLIEEAEAEVEDREISEEDEGWFDTDSANKIVQRVLSFLGVESDDLLEKFNRDPRAGYDDLKSFEYALDCENLEELTLEVCGEYNPTRVYGELHLTTPIGEFIFDGSMYRYYNSPSHLLLTEQGPISVRDCDDSFGCETVNDPCTTLDFKKCIIRTVFSPNAVFRKDMSFGTFVATTLKTYILTSPSTIKTVYMPESGMIFAESSKAFIVSGQLQIRKDQDDSEVIEIVVDEQSTPTIPPLMHSEIDSWKNKNGEEKKEKAHSLLGFNWDMDSLEHYWNHHSGKAVYFALVVVFSGITLAVIWCMKAERKERKERVIYGNVSPA